MRPLLGVILLLSAAALQAGVLDPEIDLDPTIGGASIQTVCNTTQGIGTTFAICNGAANFTIVNTTGVVVTNLEIDLVLDAALVVTVTNPQHHFFTTIDPVMSAPDTNP